MNADIVYQVAKALPGDELEKLLSLLQNDVSAKYSSITKGRKRKELITDEEAIKHLLKNIFNCNQ
ncbi:MAG: hypothetical protein PSN34_09335 [Urechidicola sp.]|nr:hypothetical protein [Urechidicola sp.]